MKRGAGRRPTRASARRPARTGNGKGTTASAALIFAALELRLFVEDAEGVWLEGAGRRGKNAGTCDALTRTRGNPSWSVSSRLATCSRTPPLSLANLEDCVSFAASGAPGQQIVR